MSPRLLLAPLAILTLSASLVARPAAVPDHDEPDSVQVDPDDVRLQRATDEARRTIRTFLTHLANPAPEMKSFMIKAVFTEGDTAESIWVSDVTYDRGIFQGRLSNDPQQLKHLRYGELVRIRQGEILDWMIVKGRKMIGGFTIRAMREMLGTKERAAFDEALGLEY